MFKSAVDAFGEALARAGTVEAGRHPARRSRAVRLDTLPDDTQTELVQAAERHRARASDGSVSHAEVSRVGRCQSSHQLPSSADLDLPVIRQGYHDRLGTAPRDPQAAEALAGPTSGA